MLRQQPDHGWQMNLSPLVLRTVGSVVQNTATNPMGMGPEVIRSQESCNYFFEAFWNEVRNYGINGRAMIHLPQGAPDVREFFPLNCWDILHPFVRAYFENWTVPGGIDCGLYTGISRAKDDNPKGLDVTSTMANAARGQLGDTICPADKVELFRSQLEPFLKRGVRWLWFDYSSDSAAMMDAAGKMFGPALVAPVGGEALPIVDKGPGSGAGGRRYDIDYGRLVRRPYLMISSFARLFDPDNRWHVDPYQHEVHLVLHGLQWDNFTPEMLKEYHDRGFIISACAVGPNASNSPYFQERYAKIRELYDDRVKRMTRLVSIGGLSAAEARRVAGFGRSSIRPKVLGLAN